MGDMPHFPDVRHRNPTNNKDYNGIVVSRLRLLLLYQPETPQSALQQTPAYHI